MNNQPKLTAEMFDRAAACIAIDRRRQFGKNLERNAHKHSRAMWSAKA